MPKSTKTNAYFRTLERSSEYKAMEKLISKALYEQWEHVVLSGLVNTFYNKYRSFFVNRRGIKIKIARKSFVEKADENDNGIEDDLEVTSSDDIKQQAIDTLQSDKLLLDSQFFNMGALMVFLNATIGQKTKNIKSYYKFNTKFGKYLKDVANKAGQAILDKLDGYKGPDFKLTKPEYLLKLKKRIEKLNIDLDKTTKKNLADQLIMGMKMKETKTQIIKRLQTVGLTKAKSRAKNILVTETQAAFEFMRFEAARMNGAKTKQWVTVGDERTCPICADLDGTLVGIEKTFNGETTSFSFDGPNPPAHINCRCYLEYVYETKYTEYIKAKKEKYVYYEATDEKAPPLMNPNAVWAGGNGLVGSDKSVGDFYFDLSELSKDKMKAALAQSGGELLIDSEDYKPKTKEGKLLQSARRKLSDIGFVQLLLSLGFNRKIPAKD